MTNFRIVVFVHTPDCALLVLESSELLDDVLLESSRHSWFTQV
jgi:hypothetical protein